MSARSRREDGRGGLLERFLEGLTKVPDPRPEIIPKKWRIPFFAGLIVAALLILALLTWLVVLPQIRQMQTRSTGSHMWQVPAGLSGRL